MKTLEELKQQCPQLVAEHRAEVVAEAQKAVREGEAGDGAKADVKGLVEASTRHRKPVEEERDGLKEKVEELQGKLDEATKRADRAETRGKVAETLDEFIAGRPYGAQLKTEVLKDFDGKRVNTVEEAKQTAERYAGFFEAGKNAPNLKGVEGGAGGDNGDGTTGGEGGDGSGDGKGQTTEASDGGKQGGGGAAQKKGAAGLLRNL